MPSAAMTAAATAGMPASSCPRMATSSSSAPGWQGRHPPARRGGCVRVVGVNNGAMINAMLEIVVMVPVWADVVSRSPSAVPRTIRLIVVGPVTAPVTASDTRRQQRRRQPDHAGNRTTSENMAHWFTSLLSFSGHSSSPKGAPRGSATTATLPPWRSIRGSTSTRPPSATTLATVAPASSTRT
jgi:hypothetical protein